MEEIQFLAEKRQEKGKGAARKLRQAGFIPGILYGPGEEPVPLQVEGKSATAVLRHLRGHNVMAELVLKDGGNKQEKIKTILKEVQKNVITGQLVHIDFYRLRMDRTVVMEIPVQLVGEAPGVHQGGILEQELREIKVEALPVNLPSSISVDISGLGIGHALLVKDLKLPETIKILEDPERVIVAILAPVKEEVAPAEAVEEAPVTTEPEVISEQQAEERRKMKEEARQQEEKS